MADQQVLRLDMSGLEAIKQGEEAVFAQSTLTDGRLMVQLGFSLTEVQDRLKTAKALFIGMLITT